MKESIIQQQICEYLSLQGIFYFAVLNEVAVMLFKMFKIPDNISFRIMTFLKKMGLVSGMPDLCILHNGTAYFLEVKNKTGKTSEQQLLIHKILTEKNFKVAIVRSVEDVKTILWVWGII